MSTRRMAVRFGIAAAVTLAGLYSVGMLWRPIPNIVPAGVFLCATVSLRKEKRWGGFGGALFLLAAATGFVSTERRLSGPLNTPGNLASVAVLAAIFAALLFFAGRVLPPRPGRLVPTLWILASIAALAFTTTHNPFVVPTAAMENTILAGDTLYFRLTGASYTPARGDIVAFRYPPDPNQVFVKRIVGIPGDRVRLRDKKLILNNVALDEPYVVHRTPYTSPFRDNFPSRPDVQLVGDWSQALPQYVDGDDLVVPPGKYFVLGDNRDNSLDSRYWGFIDRAAILGTPSFICFSANLPADAISEPQLNSPILVTPSLIRWNRLLRPVR